jgi:HlyD family secretion protein
LSNTYQAGRALLEKYTLRAPADGVVLSIRAALGSYISPQGIYGTYTGGLEPVLVMGKPEN